MGSAIDQVVDVTITKETATATEEAFNTVAVHAEFLTSKTTTPFSRARSYASLADMSKDGWGSADPVYKAALRAFAQPKPPNLFYVGRRDAADADWPAAFEAIRAENDDWYGFGIVPVATEAAAILTEKKSVRDWADTQVKIFGTSSSDSGILDSSVSTDEGTELSKTSSDRSFGVYRAAANAAEYAEIGILSRMFGSFDPGSAAFAYKKITGCTPDNLLVGAKLAAWGKFMNTYTKVSGNLVFEKGQAFSGEWLDVTVGLDWLTSDIKSTIFTALVQQPKLPYTRNGIQGVGSLLSASLGRAAYRGILDGATISITLPDIATITAAQKQARVLPDVKFSATLQGAINSVLVNGTVSA